MARCRIDINSDALKATAGRLSEVPAHPFIDVSRELKYYMETVEALRLLGEHLRQVHSSVVKPPEQPPELK